MGYMKKGYKNYKNILERYNCSIEEGTLTTNNKALLWEYVKERQANGIKDEATLGIIYFIRKFAEYVGKDLIEIKGKPGKEIVKSFFTDIRKCPRCKDIYHFSVNSCKSIVVGKNGRERIICNKALSPLSPSTDLWYKKILKRFYFWLSQNKDDTDFLITTSWINTNQLSGKCSQAAAKKREDTLLKPEDVRKMIDAAYILRDKLAIAILADTGVRAETIGASRNKRSINIGQIEFCEGYAIIHNIEEKFGKKRDVIITEALSYLIRYYNEHPYKNDPSAPLFMNMSRNKKGQRWGYSGLRNMLHENSKRSLGKIVSPHSYRHLRASCYTLDEGLSDEAKMKLMGWNSRRMLERYTHTKFEDAKTELLAKKGIIKIEDKKIKASYSILKDKECPRCKEQNTPTDSICQKCGMTLDVSKLVQNYERKNEEVSNLRHCSVF